MKHSIIRRDFIKKSALVGVAASVMPTSLFGSSSSKLQIGVIGNGLRGQGMTRLLLNRPDVDIPVICDIDEGMIEKVLKVFKKQGRPIPKIYKNGQ